MEWTGHSVKFFVLLPPENWEAAKKNYLIFQHMDNEQRVLFEKFEKSD